MVKRHEKGENVVAVAQFFGMSRIIVSKIMYNKDSVFAPIIYETPGIKNIVNN